MMYKVVLTNMAMQDIRLAALYLSGTLMNKDAANRLLDTINKKIKTLSETPYINPLVNDSFLASNGIRFQIINNYMAFYVVSEEKKTVSIIRFQHSRRDWISILKNDS
ncbi:MAG: type II toxin-antitoxin system RelE/ParE family toxin [Oscillospiraceae bacterium]|nr:type II toxin-antitoxin system RelE/ParE family toxin [Oscillospiraceae bacterium]